MSLEELLRKRIIDKIGKNPRLARKTLELAKRDIRAAEDNFKDENFDWVLAISYNAMLQAGRSLMFLNGYRPQGKYKHVAVVRFVEEFSSGEIKEDSIEIFDRMRKKRHKVIYEEPEIVSRGEAKRALDWARTFVRDISKLIG